MEGKRKGNGRCFFPSSFLSLALGTFIDAYSYLSYSYCFSSRLTGQRGGMMVREEHWWSCGSECPADTYSRQGLSDYPFSTENSKRLLSFEVVIQLVLDQHTEKIGVRRFPLYPRLLKEYTWVLCCFHVLPDVLCQCGAERFRATQGKGRR